MRVLSAEGAVRVSTASKCARPGTARQENALCRRQRYRIGIAMACVVVALSAPVIHGQDRSADAFDIYRGALANREQVRDLEARRPAVFSNSFVMNTVRQFSNRQELNVYLGELSAEARVWQKLVAEGAARRIEFVNPYERSSYVKYYDDKGDWRFTVIENDYRAAEKLRSDWNTAYVRARATADGLRRDYDALVAKQGFPAALGTEIAGMLTSASERMSQFGAPPPELLPRPVAGQANTASPSYKAFDSYTGKVIRVGRTAGNGRPSVGVSSGGNQAPQQQGTKVDDRPPSIAGTAWRWRNMEPSGGIPYLWVWFDAGGRFEGCEDPFGDRSVAGDSNYGSWRQNGNTITVVIGGTDPNDWDRGGQRKEQFIFQDGELLLIDLATKHYFRRVRYDK